MLKVVLCFMTAERELERLQVEQARQQVRQLGWLTVDGWCQQKQVIQQTYQHFSTST